MAITRTPMIDDDGSGTTGTIINNAWKQELYDQIDGVTINQGQWFDIPFSAANFTGSGSTGWYVEAGDVLVHAYALVGRTAFVQFHLAYTDVTDTPGAPLRMAIPFVALRQSEVFCYGASNDAPVIVRCLALPGVPMLHFYRHDGSPWPLSVANTHLTGQITLFV